MTTMTATPTATGDCCPACACPPWCTIDHANVWSEPGLHTVDLVQVQHADHGPDAVDFVREMDDHHRVTYRVGLWLAGDSIPNMYDMPPAEAPERLRTLAAMLLEAAETVERFPEARA